MCVCHTQDYELGPLASDKERRELVKTALEVVAMLQPLITQHQVWVLSMCVL